MTCYTMSHSFGLQEPSAHISLLSVSAMPRRWYITVAILFMLAGGTIAMDHDKSSSSQWRDDGWKTGDSEWRSKDWRSSSWKSDEWQDWSTSSEHADPSELRQRGGSNKAAATIALTYQRQRVGDAKH